jgi:hypothetical protein
MIINIGEETCNDKPHCETGSPAWERPNSSYHVVVFLNTGDQFKHGKAVPDNYRQICVLVVTYCTIKAVPTICHGGTRGARRYSSYSYLTSALDGGEWSTLRFTPFGTHWIRGWVGPEPVWTQGLEEKSFTPAGDRNPIVQPVVRHYTAWATVLLMRKN